MPLWIIRVDFGRGGFQLIPNVIGQLKGGLLRPLAVTSGKRSEILQDVPTTREVGISGCKDYNPI